MKRGASLPLNTIVIAAIVLIVLVVIIVIFGGYTRIFTGGVKSCTSVGGEGCYVDCKAETVGKPIGTMLVNVPGTNCETDFKPSKQCCKVVYEPKS